MYQDMKNMSALIKKADALALQKHDYLVPVSTLKLTSGGNKSYLTVGTKNYIMQDRAARQLAEICGIPYNYYQMLGVEYPDLLDENVNTARPIPQQSAGMSTLNTMCTDCGAETKSQRVAEFSIKRFHRPLCYSC